MRNKKIVIVVFTFMLMFFNSYVYSADIISPEYNIATKSYITEDTPTTIVEQNSSEPQIVSESAFVIETSTNKVTYKKDENKKMFPASTTKILTAILTIENSNMDDVVTASYNAVRSIPDGYSSANIKIGETLTVYQLLQVLLVQSANDAANILAEHVGGSVDSFVSMMNTKLNELGLKDTHFTNTYGMHDDNHYTTASDLAKLFQYCLKNDSFRKLAGSASCAIPSTNLSGTRSYSSTNELILPNSQYYYPYLTAGKTGYTTNAGNCLVSSAYKNDVELICVVLGGNASNSNPNNRFIDTKILYEYSYGNYSFKNVLIEGTIGNTIEIPNAANNDKSLNLIVSKTISGFVRESDFTNLESPNISLKEDIKAPISEGDVLGSISYSIDGVKYSVDLIAQRDVEESKIIIYVAFIVVGCVIIFIVVKVISYRKKIK